MVVGDQVSGRNPPAPPPKKIPFGVIWQQMLLQEWIVALQACRSEPGEMHHRKGTAQTLTYL